MDEPRPESTQHSALPFHIALLSGFRVTVGDRVLTEDAWKLRKASSLVKALALAPGHAMHREQLCDLL